jgi:hypothetical protein
MKLLKTILVIAAISMLAACSKDSAQEQAEQPVPASVRMVGVTRSSMGDDTYGDIRVLLAATGENTYTEGLFKYVSGSTWNTQVKLKSGEKTYRLYGFMPDNTDFTKSLTNWDDNGAILHIQNMTPLTDEDYCIVTGVRQVENATDLTAAVRGNYAFTYNSNRENYINLLFDHLYARLVFCMNLSTDYAALRSIKIKNMRLQVVGYSQISADITLNSEGMGAVTYNKTGSENSSVTLRNTEITLSTSPSWTTVGSVQLIPVPAMFGSLRLITEYDVFDKQGNKIAERTATNKLVEPLEELQRGEERTLYITNDPSYLYVLSDQDPPFVVITK